MTSSEHRECQGCGAVLDMTDEQIRQAVDEVLEETRAEVRPLPGTCPLCGRSSAVPVSQRKSIQFALLVALLALTVLLGGVYCLRRGTERQEIVRQAVQRAEANAAVAGFLGTPITVRGETKGQVKQDETGWQEGRVTVPITGPRGEAMLEAIGGRVEGEWRFTTLEVLIPGQHKRVDLVAGRVVDYDRDGYVEVHT